MNTLLERKKYPFSLMKKILTILIALCAICLSVNAQTTTTTDNQLREPRFRLYKTQNNWIFLKLDTMTGQIWQVQYSVDNSPRLEFVLDINERISKSYDESVCGRFALYETDNMYNFILLDTIDGRCWQVQWSIDAKNRMVLRIN